MTGTRKARSAGQPHVDPEGAAAPGSGLFGLPFTAEQSRIVVQPVPFEATTSYGGGASKGPAAILRASRQVDLFDRETGRPYEAGIAMLPIPRQVAAWNREAKRLARSVIDAGRTSIGSPAGGARLRGALERVNALGALVNQAVRKQTDRLLNEGKTVVTLGGDHSVPFGAIEAYAAEYPGVGILHVDAHCDLREAFERFTWSHASIFYNVMTRINGVARLVQVGVRDMSGREDAMIRRSRGRIVLYHDADIAARAAHGAGWAEVADEIVSRLPERVYVSFDIDGLDPSLCPHTGTPVPGGLTFHQATQLLLSIARSGRIIVGADLCEVAPGPRGDEWDANVGARLLYKMIGSILLSQARASRRP